MGINILADVAYSDIAYQFISFISFSVSRQDFIRKTIHI